MTKKELILNHNAEVIYRKHKLLIWIGCIVFTLLASIKF